ncbi:hypothetical protein FHX49_000603 [Microbacterium endophyticum]|uniref:Uncharacterized protein n=1 Tax=Microbacterium endophyticum TaxID=1526412 RepID=A0A7W4V1D2_9MICO|nr:hypothetical protein [Microbacterium endophyticum]MBB2975062.1 hypothetical protein [Microbacterium endophyticum]NIK37398.1 hypothetical protein [Microbacterium endophyticum]
MLAASERMHRGRLWWAEGISLAVVAAFFVIDDGTAGWPLLSGRWELRPDALTQLVPLFAWALSVQLVLLGGLYLFLRSVSRPAGHWEIALVVATCMATSIAPALGVLVSTELSGVEVVSLVAFGSGIAGCVAWLPITLALVIKHVRYQV